MNNDKEIKVVEFYKKLSIAGKKVNLRQKDLEETLDISRTSWGVAQLSLNRFLSLSRQPNKIYIADLLGVPLSVDDDGWELKTLALINAYLEMFAHRWKNQLIFKSLTTPLYVIARMREYAGMPSDKDLAELLEIPPNEFAASSSNIKHQSINTIIKFVGRYENDVPYEWVLTGTITTKAYVSEDQREEFIVNGYRTLDEQGKDRIYHNVAVEAELVELKKNKKKQS